MPAAKRRKLATSTVEPKAGAQSPSKHDLFTEWSKHRGVKIHKVTPLARPGRGLGLVTTDRFKKGDLILFVPVKAIFKPDFKLLQKLKNPHSASPHVQLTISLMETVMSEDSDLKDWKATWPTWPDFEESMPIFWEKILRAEMPKSAELPLERQSIDFTADKLAVDSYLKQKKWQSKDFDYYWTIVNTRSFHFKPPGNRPGYMVLCPFIDYLNHAPTGSSVEISQSEKGYEVIADRDYEAGEELFATYGAHSNDKLLIQYGFICATDEAEASSADDDIRLDHYILERMEQSNKDQLQDVGYLGGYYINPTTLEICFRTQVAVRAVLLTATEWEYFIGCGEDLGADQSRKVLDWLAVSIKDFVDEAGRKRTLLTSGRLADEAICVNLVGKKLLARRWEQIERGLVQFQKANKLSKAS